MPALVLLAMAAAQPLSLPQILSRISEEAEVFRQVAPQTLAEETLQQRALKPPPRFHPRIGAAAREAPKPQYQAREIVSEYSYSTLRDAPGVLHEFRQVVSVDGRPVATPEKARHSLTLGLKSADERAKKRLLEEFQKYGLLGAATDFGQILLLFTRREIGNYEFRPAGSEWVGPDQAQVLDYRQKGGADSFLVFEGRKALRQKLEGRVWVRASDGLPLRVSLRSSWSEDKHVRRHEATVDYVRTPFGMLAPAAVKHSEYLDDQLRVEDLFRYTPFRKFSADAEIKFQTVPEQK